MEIITDLTKLQVVAGPLEFITDRGIEKEEGEKIIKKLKAFLNKNKNVVAITAPQLGIDKRVFCMRFADTIKTFINPVITKKTKHVIRPETFASMPGQEILISRPEEVTVVYYTDEFKYEENKLLGIAARVFDQSAQLLDGVTPDIMGVATDVEQCGSLWDLSDEDMQILVTKYKEIVAARANSFKKDLIAKNPALEKQYNELRFTEKVINGEANIVGKGMSKRGQAVAALSLKRNQQQIDLANRANRVRFINRKGR